eukprot:9272964-Lingulodinium_polyedra.AAC.1
MSQQYKHTGKRVEDAIVGICVFVRWHFSLFCSGKAIDAITARAWQNEEAQRRDPIMRTAMLIIW